MLDSLRKYSRFSIYNSFKFRQLTSSYLQQVTLKEKPQLIIINFQPGNQEFLLCLIRQRFEGYRCQSINGPLNLRRYGGRVKSCNMIVFLNSFSKYISGLRQEQGSHSFLIRHRSILIYKDNM